MGLGLATVVVLMARLVPLPYSPLQLAVAVVIVAVVIALLLGWHRRPDALDVAIRADLALRLKQRLSTAWEYMTVHGDAELAERLARQAVKARLPARAGLVFPLRVNRWGWLAPLAATALLLAGVLDLNRIQAPAPRKVDERVVDEGKRLSAVGREIQARATREKLPRSAKQAEQLERLGARMEGGGLSRSESLALLRQLGKSLEEVARRLVGTDRTNVAALRPDGEAPPLAPGRNPGEMLERLLGGVPGSYDSRALAQYLNDLTRSGIPRRQAEEALKRHQAGDIEALRDILEKLAQIERALREQELLQIAREQVRRAQENLGESQAATQGGHGLAADTDEGEDREGDRVANPRADRRLTGEMSRGASRYGAQSDSSVAADRQPAPMLADPGKSGPILKPQGQVREGEELVTQGQVLPRAGRPSVENMPMRAEFASQVEEVLSREQYPAHSKEFIRRYFLNLSQGARVPRQPTQGAQ
ncbi:MAG TPA: hypothetical protein VES36_00440 [Candidatus Limnocylindrales bacterium]|nr:hypothetical protein [Candidatus Limnocylindrales bacterium]